MPENENKPKWGGKRTGAGRRKEVKPQELSGPLTEKRNLCQEVLAALNDPKFKHCEADSKTKCLKCLLIEDARDPGALGNSTRKWLTEMAQGKAVHHINHMHDKPIEVNHHFDLGEELEKARKRVLGK